MLHPSTKKLIDKLGEMTLKQKVAWIEGEDGTIVHDTEGYRVVLSPEPHGVVLTDAVGREIETCTPEEIADEKAADGRPYSQFLSELFREAHRHARGTEQAIRALLAGLEAADQEEEAAAGAAVPAPEPAPEPEPESATDETAQMDGETEITAAVATLADQINKTAPAAGPEVEASAPESAPEAAPEAAPVSEPLPDAYAEPEPETAPEAAAQPEPELSPAPEPEPEPEPELTPEPETEVTAAPVTLAEAAPAEETPPQAEDTGSAAPDTPPPPQQAAAEETPPAPAGGLMQQRFSLSGIPYGAGALGTAPAAPPPEKPPEPAPSPAPRTLIIDGTEDLPDTVPGLAEPSDRVVSAQGDEEEGGEGGQPLPPRRFNPWN